MKQIKGFPSYSITIKGKIWNNKYKRWLKPALAKNGYCYCSFREKGKRYYRPIHRLVLSTFVGLCPEGMECCHNNGIKTDNRLGNLRWDTTKANAMDSMKHGTRIIGEQKHNAKLTEKDVINIIHLWNTKLFRQQEIADMYGMSVSHINGIIHRRYWKHLLCD